MADVAFILVRQVVLPEPGSVIDAARRYGLELVHDTASAGGAGVGFRLASGASLTVMLMPFPHPDAPSMLGVTSPPPEDLAAPAHLVVAALGLTGPDRERDTTMAALAGAVINAVDAAGAMLGHGVAFHRAILFADAARLAADEHQPLAVEVAVDVTAAQESATRMSFLTHGLARYGREELYVTCPVEGRGALSFVFDMARWLLADPDKYLPTGDTVGRSEDEKLPVQRVANPTGQGPQVIRLDLPD